MDERRSELLRKFRQVTLLFWIIMTMSWLGETTSKAKGTGYLIGTVISPALLNISAAKWSNSS